MTDKRIPQLDQADTLTGAEELHLVQGNVSRRVSLSELVAFVNATPVAQTFSAPFRGALLRRSTDVANIVFPLFFPWELAEYDTDAFWSPAAITRLTVPPGVTKVRLSCSVRFTNNTAAGSLYTTITKNGEDISAVNNVRQSSTGYGDNVVSTSTPVLPVTQGDYFEIRVNKSGMSGINSIFVGSNPATTFFALEVVEAMEQ